MIYFAFKRFVSVSLLVASVGVLPACAVFQSPAPAAAPAPVAAEAPQIEINLPAASAPTPAPATAAATQPAPSRYMQFVKEKKPLFEMDMKTGPACQSMATSFGRSSTGERTTEAVRCNPRSVSAALPVSAVMKNPKTKNNYIARFRNKEFCTRVLDTMTQNGKSTVVRECVERKKA